MSDINLDAIRVYREKQYKLSDLPFVQERGCGAAMPNGFTCTTHYQWDGETVHIATGIDHIVLNAYVGELE